MRLTKITLILSLFIVLSPSIVFAELSKAEVAARQKQLNKDLDNMAYEITKLCTQPGFRGFVRSSIAKTKNREGIIELDDFLAKAKKQKGMPPGLSKFTDLAGKAKGRLKSSGVWDVQGLANPGYDLYIPVNVHRKKWKGGKDFLVAYSPVDDEKDIKEIVAYSVRDGKRVILNPNKAPQSVVMVVAPCEHESHQDTTKADAASLPTPKNIGSPETYKSPGEPGKYKGNSKLYAYYTIIKNDHEPWYRGKPEIEVYLFQEKYSGTKGDVKRLDCTGVNSTNKAYYTAGYGVLYFDLHPYAGYSDITVVAIWERDGGSWILGDCCEFAKDKIRCFNVRSGDDYVALGGIRHRNRGRFYKSAFQYYYLWERSDNGGGVLLYKTP